MDVVANTDKQRTAFLMQNNPFFHLETIVREAFGGRFCTENRNNP